MYPSHHALLYFGQKSFDREDFMLQHRATHDIIVQTYEELRIDDARQLIALALQTPLHHDKQVFVIQAETLAIEAQHALLKLLEEPPSVSSFVFVVTQDTILPTLRSRCFVVSAAADAIHIATQVFTDFIHASIPERLAIISALSEKKNVAEFRPLAEGLRSYLDTQKHVLTLTQKQTVSWLLQQMPLRGASQKMLWEEVVFTVPVEG